MDRDAYRKDSSKKSINHDKPGGKTSKISTASRKAQDNQKKC